MKLLVTGGMGFIGSAVVRLALKTPGTAIVNLEKVTYAAHEETLRFAENNPAYSFEKADICDAVAVRRIVFEFQPDAIMHLAA